MAFEFAICNETFQGWSLQDTLTKIAEIGYQGVEIAPFTLAADVNDLGVRQRREIRSLAQGLGLKISGLHWLLVSPPGLYLNHPDPAIRQRTQAYLEALMAFCGDLGGKVLVLGSPKQRNVLPEERHETVWERTRAVLEGCMPAAERYGVTLCLEPLDKYQTNFINTVEEAIGLIDAVDHPRCRMIIDVRATLAQEQDIEQTIRVAKGHMAHFHANDANGLGPGFGEVDFAPIMASLAEVGYGGVVSVEVFDYNPGAERIARQSLDYLSRFL